MFLCELDDDGLEVWRDGPYSIVAVVSAALSGPYRELSYAEDMGWSLAILELKKEEGDE